MAYAPALELQRETLGRVASGGGEPNALLLVEHDPVITVSQRRESAKHLLAAPEVERLVGVVHEGGHLAKAAAHQLLNNLGGDGIGLVSLR